jgi:hypothetical protein
MAGIHALRRLAVGLVVLTLAVPVVAQVPAWQEPNGIRNNGNQ